MRDHVAPVIAAEKDGIAAEIRKLAVLDTAVLSAFRVNRASAMDRPVDALKRLVTVQERQAAPGKCEPS